MNVPNKPGPYWWQERAAQPAIIVKVEKWPTGDLGFSVERQDGAGWWERSLVADSESEQWGERIPDSDTLKAMREVVRRGPPLDETKCACCGNCVAGFLAGEHAPDCAWERAQEKPDE